MANRRAVLIGLAAVLGGCKLRARSEAPRLHQAPEFDLPNQHGNHTVLSSLLASGHVLVVFYRGRW